MRKNLENIKEAITAWLWAEDQKAVWLHAPAAYPNRRGEFELFAGALCYCRSPQSLTPQQGPIDEQAREYFRERCGKGIQ